MTDAEFRKRMGEVKARERVGHAFERYAAREWARRPEEYRQRMGRFLLKDKECI